MARVFAVDKRLCLHPSAPSGVTFNWYDVASNGNLLFSGSTFTTPTLNSNTTYYVESENGSGCKSTRTSVTVTIDAAPQSQQSVARYLQWTNGYAYTKCSIRCYVQLVRCCIEWQFYCLVVLRLHPTLNTSTFM
ncbi:MAG: hypothetical protein IPN93_17725 [Bacteroidetes bacterium]|nr:hypothetical protein [Bacteroidota bacterium]